jgi:arsenate reductase-like glutaredoxin family protein
LLELGARLQERDVGRRPLSVPELDALIGPRPVSEFLSTRNELYRERGMKEHPPPRSEALQLISEHPNLLRRPVARLGDRVVIGYDEPGLRDLAAMQARTP